MKSSKSFFLFLSLAIILMGYLFIPVTNDLSIFALGGKTIAEGGNIYYDFIDSKPPLLFLTFAFIYKTIGISQFALRGFDFCLQLLSACLFFVFIRKYFKDQLFAYLSSLIYIISFMTLQMFHPENFTGIILILISFLIFSEKQNFFRYFLIGMLSAFLGGLKFTLGVVIIGVIIYDFINKKTWKEFLIKLMAYSLGFIIIICISVLPLLEPKSMRGYLDVMDFLTYYANLPHLDSEFIRFSLKKIGEFFGDNYSILLFGMISIGIVKYLIMNNHTKVQQKYYQFIFIQLFLLFFSIISERKFGVYFFLRLYIPLSLLSGLGLTYIINILKTNWKSWTVYNKTVVSCLILFSLALSPIARLTGIYLNAINYFINYSKYINWYQRTEESSTSLLKDYIDISNMINNDAKKDDFVLVMIMGGNLINYYTENFHHSKFSQSAFYFTPYLVSDWQEMINDEFKKADWIILQTNDRHEMITGSSLSSIESLKADSSKYNYFKENYSEYRQIDSFYIYKRK